MPRLLPPARLAELAALVERRLGLHFPESRHGDLERGIAGASREFGFSEVEACVEWLLHTPLRRAQIETLASHLTIGETYFFREPRTFSALEAQVLPELIRQRRAAATRHLRIWSAGCASGEETYSLAITLHQALPDLAEWRLSILGTDINPRALSRAAEGIYGDWSFRATPPWVKERYFEKVDERRYAIAPAIRTMVRFAYLNLAEDTYPALLNGTAAVDLLFCRNALLYFPPAQTARVMERFHRALVEGGWLVGGLAEPFCAPGFEPVPIGGGAIYRKAAAPLSVAAPPSPSAVASPPLALPAPPRVLPLPAPAVTSASATAHARACAGRGELAEALRRCEDALAADKLDPALHFLRATILTESGDVTEGELALRRVLFLDPDSALAHFALAMLLEKAGRRRDSARHLDLALASLRSRAPEEVLPESDGLTAGRLAAMIQQSMRVQQG
jgi:chemotaxis protein methyltransferase CheR